MLTRSAIAEHPRCLRPFFSFLGPLPATDGFLTNPADHKPTGLNIIGYRGPRTDRDAPPDCYRCDELRVGAYENVIFEYRFVFESAIVIAGDRTGTDIDARADFGVTDVAQMINLAVLGDI